MQGLMQSQPLLLTDILEHAALSYGDTEIVSWEGGSLFRYNYAAAAARARRVASSLSKLGFGPGDVLGSIAWTTYRHYELMYAVPGIGAVLHTINPRLSAEHINYTINHSRERVLFVDPDRVQQVEQLRPQLPNIETYVILGSNESAPATTLPNVLYYEDLVAGGDPEFRWPTIDENSGSTLCYTSGTTGDPKGVLYSHRGTYLSSLAIAGGNAWATSARDAIILLAPFFHCNAWGAPYLGPMAGAKLILPGRALDGRSVQQLIVNEGATVGPGVPTVWMAVVEHCQQSGANLGKLNRIVCGGAAPPLEMMRTLWRQFGVRTVQVWGMTETTHAATIHWTEENVLSGEVEPTAPQGRPIFGTRLRIIDDEGRELPRDGKAIGHLQVAAPWCASTYFRREDAAINDSGWLRTGDLAAIEPGNRLRITDRLKDVIKSGGEWVSSIDLENAALGHPSVAQAAVIGVPHPRWQERPAIYVVKRQGTELSVEDLIGHLSTLVAKWWLPEEVIFVEDLPYNSTGKVRKEELRRWYREGRRAG